MDKHKDKGINNANNYNNPKGQTKVKYIKRTNSQAQTFERNIQEYLNTSSQSLEKIQEHSPKKTLSRKNSQMSTKFKNSSKPQVALDLNAANQPQKRFVARTIEDIAMHLASSIFMMATTRYLADHSDLSSMRDASQSKNKRVPPIRDTREKSVPTKKAIVETPKKPLTPVKQSILTPTPSIASILQHNSPRMGQVGPTATKTNQKSQLQKQFDALNSQNASRESRPEVRIKEIQPSQIYHVASGIRTKYNQPSHSAVKTERSFNPENSIQRYADNVNVRGGSTARYATLEQDRSVSPLNKRAAYKPHPQQETPRKPLKQSISQVEQSPTRARGGATPIKSTIQLQSRTDLPRLEPIKPPQPAELPQKQTSRTNRFQAQVAREKQPVGRVPARTPQPNIQVKPQEQRATSMARYTRQQQNVHSQQPQRPPINTSKPQKSFPYKDSLVKPKGPPSKSVISIDNRTPSAIKRNVQESSYHMVTELFLSSTTKYNKEAKFHSNKKLVPPRYSHKKEGSELIQQEASVLKQTQEIERERSFSRNKVQKLPQINKTDRFSQSKVSQTRSPYNKNPETERQQPRQTFPQPQPYQRYGVRSPQAQAVQSANQIGLQAETRVNPEDNSNTRALPKKQPQRDLKDRRSATQIPLHEKESQQKAPVNQIHNRYGNKMTRNQKPVNQPSERKIQKIDVTKNVIKDETTTPKGTPFTRQPAGNRSPLLFIKSPQQDTKETALQVKSGTPVINLNKDQLVNIQAQNIKKIDTNQNKARPEAASNPNLATYSPRTLPYNPPYTQQPNISKKESEPAKRPGPKPVQVKQINDDSSMKSAQNTANTIVASKSTDTFQRVWKPAQPSRVNYNKHQNSNSVQVVEANPPKTQSKHFYSPKSTQQHVEPPSSKTVPSEDVNTKRSPPNRYGTLPSIINEVVGNHKSPTNNKPNANNNSKMTSQTNIYSSPNQYKPQPQKTVNQFSKVNSTKIIGQAHMSAKDPHIKSQSKFTYRSSDKVGVNSYPQVKEGGVRVRHERQAILLALTVQTSVDTIIVNRYEQGFQKLKNALLKAQRTNKPSDVKVDVLKQKSANLLNIFFIGKVKEYFKQFKNICWSLKQLAILDHSKKQNVSNSNDFSLQQKYEKNVLNSLVTIVRNYNTVKLKKGFETFLLHSIASVSIKKPSKGVQAKNPIIQTRSPPKTSTARNYQAEKSTLLETKTNLEREVASIQYHISDKKRYQERQKAKLIKKMQELRKKVSQAQTRVAQGRKKQEQFSRRVPKVQDSDELKLPEGEPLIGLLTQLYSQVFKIPEDQNVDIQSLIKKFSISRQDSNPIIQQWTHLIKNVELKTQITLWEGIGKKEGKLRRQLLDQRQTEVNLMKTYVRERYFWEWVHTASSKI